MYDAQYKYLHFEYQREAELYDLAKDPAERENLINALPEVASALEAKLIDWEEQHKPKMTSPLSPQGARAPRELMESMRSLGYVR